MFTRKINLEKICRDQELRYVALLGWFIWDGSRWVLDKDGEPTRRVLATLRVAIHEAADAEKDARRALTEDVRKCESATGIKGVLATGGALKPVAIPHDVLDAAPELFATPGGTVDLKAGTVRPNDRLDHITKLAGAKPGECGAETWTRFLWRVLPDEDVRAYVQRLMGVSLLGEVREQILPIFTGTGANGKGVFRDAIMAAFGDYAIEVDPALLMESKHERHGTYKMQLRGARLVFTSETGKGKSFSEAEMKRLTGGDNINANLMHKDAITFAPSHTLVMITNHLPEVSGDDPAVWRRIQVVPFDQVIPIEERDPDLTRKIREAAPAVLSWAIDGWRAYAEAGLNPPNAVLARTAEYQASADVLSRFSVERCYVNKNATVRARDLFDTFQRWCLKNGERPPTEKGFAESMTARGYAKKRVSSGFVYPGIGLYAEDEEVA